MKKASTIRIDGNVAFISMTRGYEATIDATDIPLVEGRSWYADVCACTVYAVTTVGRNPRRQVSLHRTLLAAPREVLVDHIDRNGLNNRRDNLRLATPSQNAMNSQRRPGTSGLRGVSWHRRIGKWQAKIKASNTTINLGYYIDPNEAYAAYCSAAKRLHGEFARLS